MTPQAAMPFDSRRSTVYGCGGMVAASQPLAAQAGLRILLAGGNAADAAVAVAACLNVTEPTSTGIGGDAFALFFDATTHEISALNGSGRTPSALNLDLLRGQGIGVSPGLRPFDPFSPHTITVPGAAAAWCDLIERHGTQPLRELLAPAIELAERGFPVAPLTSYFWARGVERQLRHAPGGDQLMIEGRAPHEGEIFRNPGLARTFRTLAEGGKRAFYEGPIAEAIVAVMREAGGLMTATDLAGHLSTWDHPIHADYHGVRVHECPPNGQGLATLLALNIVRQFSLPPDPLGPERLHLLIEALRLAFADTRWFAADPATNPAPLQQLLSDEYAAERARLISMDRATVDQTHGSPVAGSDTVYFCVVDGLGNACSFINSNYMGFGTGISPRGWGFTLQNRGHGFSLDPSHPNALAPGKRPYHTIIPGLLTRVSDGALMGPFGVMGGFMQPQGHLLVSLALLADGLDPQAALDRPRLCIEDGTAGGAVAVEEGIPVASLDRLAAMGHEIRRVSGMERALFGRGQIILRDSATGVLQGGSDPRADGLVAAF